MIKAHAVRLFAVALALAGVVAAVLFTTLVLWPNVMAFVPAANVEAWLPEWLLAWLPKSVHPGLLLAALGAVTTALGVLIAVRQAAIIRVEKRRREDRLRRVRVYQSDQSLQPASESRLEPFIGPGGGSQRQPDRRVA